jgi:hypothetical protein
VRKKTFTVGAESVQGNEGATVTFRAIKRGTWRAYLTGRDFGDDQLVAQHLVSWSGFVDDEGNELPQPSDQSDVLDELYFHEVQALAKLLAFGPNGPDALKN